MNAVLSLFSCRFGGTAVKQTCPTCDGKGTGASSQIESHGWVDPDQPAGFEPTAGFAQFIAEPQSPALREPKSQRKAAVTN